MRNTGAIQKRHAVAAHLQREECDARLRSLRLLDREARSDRSMMLISSCNPLALCAIKANTSQVMRAIHVIASNGASERALDVRLREAAIAPRQASCELDCVRLRRASADKSSLQRKIALQFCRELLAMEVVQSVTASRDERRYIQARDVSALRPTSAWAAGPSAFPCP
ncbi:MULTISPECIES: hypothetical protein [unclassified Bradyrhizobium]|uniref:hypothetical protein n=1 Tax=unclassified Bradyrhizobium TaxID=2631580 RepID=UPI0012EBE16C|nr:MULTISPECIES: hypothetical protein [unclassified Bradyrhizobium]QIG97474.1 hypothetical protein G6P99_37260 [Bradyrhizobium sp. 6(2017)]